MTIIFKITSGVLDVIASLDPSVGYTITVSSYNFEYAFVDIPDGSYTIHFIDGNGCELDSGILECTTTTTSTSTSSTTTTTTTYHGPSTTTTTTTCFGCTTTTTSTTVCPDCCGMEHDFDGLHSYPNIRTVHLGPDTGVVNFSYDAVSYPDRYIVFFPDDSTLDNIVIDTGYVGDIFHYDYGMAWRSHFTSLPDSMLTGATDPTTGLTYPDIPYYGTDGFPRIVGDAIGSTSFVKSTVDEYAYVHIYSPMLGTYWHFRMDCPPTTTTTTTPAPSTTTTTSSSTTSTSTSSTTTTTTTIPPTTSTTTTSIPGTTTTTTTICTRPGGLILQNSVISAWGTSISPYNFSGDTVNEVCAEFTEFKDAPTGESNFIAFWPFEAESMTEGKTLWLYHNQTDCQTVYSGNYWYSEVVYPPGPSDYKALTSIQIITVGANGVVTAITECDYITTTTTTTIPSTTTTTSSTSSTTTTTTTVFENCVEYGLLYNWYASGGTEDSSISSSDDWSLLNPSPYLTGTDKSTGYTYWETPNTGAANTNEMNIRGGGIRNGGSGGYIYFQQYAFYRINPTTDYQYFVYNSNTIGTGNGGDRYRMGMQERLVNTSTSLNVGDYGTYTGNDGRVYKTKCIYYAAPPYKVEIMMCDLIETKLRDGTLIPYVSDNATWGALNTAAMCPPNGDWSNVGCDMTAPTTTTTTTEIEP